MENSISSKNTPKVDPRVRRTRRLLRDAIVSLIMEKDYGSISIRDVTERAEVAYITFFRHFESLDDLLMEVLEEGLTELRSHIESLAKQSETSALETEGTLIFEYIRQKANLFRILLKSQSAARIRKKVVRTIADIFRQSCTPLASSNNPMAIDMMSNHIATSLLSLIEWWIDNNMQPAPAQMGRVYKSLIIDSTVRTASSMMALSN